MKGTPETFAGEPMRRLPRPGASVLGSKHCKQATLSRRQSLCLGPGKRPTNITCIVDYDNWSSRGTMASPVLSTVFSPLSTHRTRVLQQLPRVRQVLLPRHSRASCLWSRTRLSQHALVSTHSNGLQKWYSKHGRFFSTSIVYLSDRDDAKKQTPESSIGDQKVRFRVENISYSLQ